jgi:siroheme synthase
MSNEHEEPVVIERYKTEFEAMLTKNMLEEAGIPCEVVGGMTAGFRAETPGFVEVLVPGQYAERALKLLIASTKEQTEGTETPGDGDA